MTELRQIAVRCLALLLLAFAATSAMQAQEFDPSSPLGAKTIYPRIGVVGGLDRTEMTGEFTIGCGRFEGGEGTNVLLGVTFDMPIADRFRLDAIAGFRTRNVAGRYTTVEPSIIQASDRFVETPITYEHIGSLNSSYLFLQPGVTAYPLSWLYLGVGANVGLSLGGDMGYSRDIASKVVTLDNGEVLEAFYPLSDSPDPHSRRFPDETPEERATVLIDPVGYIGAEFSIWRDYFIGPRITYSYPVMEAVIDPAATLSSLRASILIRTHLR